MPRRSELVMQKVVDRVIDMYHNQGMTQADIAATLCKEGYQTSKSAVGRVVKKHAQFLKEIDLARKEAEAIVLATQKIPGTDIIDSGLQITAMKLVDELRGVDNLGELDNSELVNALSKVARAQGYIAKVKMDYEKGRKAGLFEAMRGVEEASRELGISEESMKFLMKRAFGASYGG